jgi:ribosome-associated protein
MRIPVSELEFTYARSSGPGGQNVNKVSSKAVLRWNLLSSPSLSVDLRERLVAKLAHRLTKLGDIVVTSDRFRDQIKNHDDCIEKLNDLVSEALAVPKARKKTKPTRSSKRKKLDAKSHHSKKKGMRQRVGY